MLVFRYNALPVVLLSPVQVFLQVSDKTVRPADPASCDHSFQFLLRRHKVEQAVVLLRRQVKYYKAELPPEAAVFKGKIHSPALKATISPSARLSLPLCQGGCNLEAVVEAVPLRLCSTTCSHLGRPEAKTVPFDLVDKVRFSVRGSATGSIG